MEIRELLQQALDCGASDMFIIAGLSLPSPTLAVMTYTPGAGIMVRTDEGSMFAVGKPILLPSFTPPTTLPRNA